MTTTKRFGPWVPTGVAALGAVGLAASGERRLGALVAVALLGGVGLLVEVELPWGGRAPLGVAGVIATIVLVTPLEAVGVLAVVALVFGPHRPLADLSVVLAGGAAGVAALSLVASVVVVGASDSAIVGEVALVGGAYLGVDLLLRDRSLRLVAGLYVTLLSAAALLAIAYTRSPALAPVAAVPLLVTRYSFGRLALARRTYAQTTQALSLLPEVAGLSPLGHGERTAVYANALGERLGLDLAELERVATAARLHHIGHISLDDVDERSGPLDVAELRRISGELLRGTGFLHDVADLVERSIGGHDEDPALDAAIIRVCSTLDDLAESGTERDPFTALLRLHRTGTERTAAIALLALHDRRPEILEEARRSSSAFALVAGASGSGAGHHAHDESDDCR